MGFWRLATALSLLIGSAPAARAEGNPSAERGRKALLERTFIPATIPLAAYQGAWRYWPDGPKQAPANYAEAFAEHYGLHPAPYPNKGYPMGMQEATWLLSKGLAFDCMVCHGGSVAGQSVVGLGNASLDFQSLVEDLARAAGRSGKTPFAFCNVRGTSEAGTMAVYLLERRQPDMQLRTKPLDLGLRDDLCEDVPAWWLLKKKKTMYHTGMSDARSVRSIMQFMLNPLNTPTDLNRAEPAFADIQAYLLTLEPPRYPFPVDAELARRGEAVFRQNCSKCHGTYGENGTYPNKVVPIDVIGTDRTRFEGFSDRSGEYYNRTWLAQERRGWLGDDFPIRPTVGYQAPPLDGVWATAPYFHNGSAPTVYDVLSSKTRPRIFTRSYRTDREAYDPVRLGWKFQLLDRGADPNLPAVERRKVYDTAQPGRGNGGHRFGDDLTDQERMAVIEYLKTL